MKVSLSRMRRFGGCAFLAAKHYMCAPQFRVRARYAKQYKKKGIKEKVILYEVFGGQSMTGKVFDAFKQLHTDGAYKKLKHVWVFGEDADCKEVMASYKDDSRVCFVERDSKQYMKYLASAKYLINNEAFPAYFTKKEGQIYINVWEGSEVKSRGFEDVTNIHEAGMQVRDFMQSDYLVASDEATCEVYKRAFRLEGLYAGKIIRNIEEVFAGEEVVGERIDNDKTKILFWRGHMKANGITTSFLNLLREIDYEKYDVSIALTPGPTDEDEREMKNIYEKVRVFYRGEVENFTYWENVRNYYLDNYAEDDMIHSMFAREMKRCFGQCQFDYIIDFEGYNQFYQKFLVQDKKAKKIVWQHNDMMAECTLKYPYLEKCFHLYPYFDRVVSCSKAIMEVNRETIGGKYCAKEKFSYARNFVDIKRVERGAKGEALCEYEGKTWIRYRENSVNQCVEVGLAPFIPETDESGKRNYRFVTMGRFSMEKNHKNLLDAFAALYERQKNVYLYIMGDGPLREEMEEQIRSLGVESQVFLTGNIENPFAIMKHCDCFLLPSLHEGQPMVVNEARVMHMPLVLSDFSSVKGVCMENGQLVVGSSKEEIEKGLEAFIRGEVPSDYEFDAEKYNKKTYLEFLHAIGE